MKTALCILVSVLFAALPYSVKGQQTEEGMARIGSLQKKLADHKRDTGKVQLLNDIAYEYNKISPYDGIRYAMQALALAEELHWKTGEAQANSALGANYFSLSDFPNAYAYWLKSLKINEELDYKPGIANHLHNIGNIYASQKNYTEALAYYNEGLKASEENGNKKLASNSYTSIGKVYTKLKDYQKALEYHFKALNIDQELGLKGSISADQINIGSIYNDQGNYPKALAILYQAMQMKKDMGDRNGLANAYSMVGNVFLHIAAYVSTAENDTASSGDKNSNLQHAVEYLDSAIMIDKEIGYLDNMQSSYEYRSDAEEMEHDEKEAFGSYKQYILIKDSIYSIQKQTEIFNLEKKAEIEEKEREMEKATEEKERKEYIQISGICAFIVIFISATLLLRHKKINPRIIEILGTASILIIFEFIQLLLHAKIEKITHENMVLTLMCLMAIAAVIIPLHHKTEHWMKEKIGRK